MGGVIVDLLIVMAAILMVIAGLITNSLGQVVVWTILGLYAYFNFLERRNYGS